MPRRDISGVRWCDFVDSGPTNPAGHTQMAPSDSLGLLLTGRSNDGEGCHEAPARGGTAPPAILALARIRSFVPQPGE